MVWALADFLLYLIPLVLGVLTSFYQKDIDEEPSKRLFWFGYAGAFAVFTIVTLHLLSILQYLPRMAHLFGVANVPLGFVLGYFVFQIIFKKEKPERKESILLIGLIISGIIANLLFNLLTTFA